MFKRLIKNPLVMPVLLAIGVVGMLTAFAYAQAIGGYQIPMAQVASDWNATTGVSVILNKPTWANVAYTGAYTDVSGTPTIVNYCYDGSAKRTNCIPYFSSAVVASGMVQFNMTVDGTSGAASIFPNGLITGSVNVFCSDAAVPYSAGVVVSNGGRTVVATVNKAGSSFLSLLGLNVLTAPAAGNGTTCNIQAMGY